MMNKIKNIGINGFQEIKYRMNFFLEDGDEEFIEEEAVYED